MLRRNAARLVLVPLSVLLVLALSGLAIAMPTTDTTSALDASESSVTEAGTDDETVADVEDVDDGVVGVDDRDATADVNEPTVPGGTSSGGAIPDEDGQPGGPLEGEIFVTKVADDHAVPASGQQVTFTFTVKNHTNLRFWIEGIHDDSFGTLTGDADCMVGTELASGESCSFTHSTWLEGAAGTSHVNTVTVDVQHFSFHKAITATETVRFEAVSGGSADLWVDKRASRTTVPASGAEVTFTFEVKNTGSAALKIHALRDDVFGTLSGDADCMVGTELASGERCWFTHTAWIDGNHVNTFTAAAEVLGTDRVLHAWATEHVKLGSGGPLEGELSVTKVADDDIVPASGQQVTFTFTVRNDTNLRFWIESIHDDVFGTLSGDADCMVGTELESGEWCTFSHSAWLQGTAGTDHVNTVTVEVRHFSFVKALTDTETVRFEAVAGSGGTGNNGGGGVLGAGGGAGNGDDVANQGGTAFTGTNLGMAAAIGAVLLVLGLSAVMLARRPGNA